MNIIRNLACKLGLCLTFTCSLAPVHAEITSAAQMDFEAGVTAYAEERYEVARTLYTKACDANLAKSCYNLGEMLVQDDGSGNAAQARLYHAKACDGGVADGCSRLGWMYKVGLGGKEDTEQAEIYYEKACDLGDQNMCLYK